MQATKQEKEKKCVQCGAPLPPRRHKYCSGKCNRAFVKAERRKANKEAKVKTGSWSLDEREEDQDEGNVFSLNSLEKREFESLGVDPDDPPLIETSDPPGWPSSSYSPQDDLPMEPTGPELRQREEAHETFAAYMENKEIWSPGESWLEVFVFDGDFDTEFDGDFDSDWWEPATGRIWDQMSPEELTSKIRQESGPGYYQIRFFRTGVHAPRQTTPPLLLRVYGRDMARRRKKDAAAHLAIEARSQLEQEKERQWRQEMAATDKVLEFQEKQLAAQQRKEELLQQEIKDLRDKSGGGNDDLIRIMEMQLQGMQEEKRLMMQQMEALRLESSQKDRNIFQTFMEREKERENERKAEQRRLEEFQQQQQRLLMERDNRFFDAMRSNNERPDDYGAGQQSDFMNMLMAMMQQQTKSQEFFMLQQQEDRRRQEMREENNRKDWMMMLNGLLQFNSQTKDDGGKNQATDILMSQYSQSREELLEMRRENARLTEKFIDELNGRRVEGANNFVEQLEAIADAKSALGTLFGVPGADSKEEDGEEKNPAGLLGSGNIEDSEPQDILARAEKLAQTINLGSIVEAISSRIGGKEEEKPARPPTLPPPAAPAAPPPAYPQQQMPYVPEMQPLPQQPDMPGVHTAAQAQKPPGNGMQQQQTATNEQPAEQGSAVGQEPEYEEELTPEGEEIFYAIERAIKENLPPEAFIEQIPQERLEMLKMVPQSKLVDTVLSHTESPLIRSVRGRDWLANVANYIHQNT